jgi:hypothetical protein
MIAFRLAVVLRRRTKRLATTGGVLMMVEFHIAAFLTAARAMSMPINLGHKISGNGNSQQREAFDGWGRRKAATAGLPRVVHHELRGVLTRQDHGILNTFIAK